MFTIINVTAYGVCLPPMESPMEGMVLSLQGYHGKATFLANRVSEEGVGGSGEATSFFFVLFSQGPTAGSPFPSPCLEPA